MKPLPIGIDFFRKLREGDYYYVDKTGTIAELLEQRAKATLITRPRRFGKTLCMDMVREFFDIEADSAALFQGLKIMDGPYRGELNSRPVLSFSFKDCKGEWPLMTRQIKTSLEREYDRWEPFAAAGLTGSAKRNYEDIREALGEKRNPDMDPLWNAIAFLSEIVASHYGKPAMILIDEYDTPMDAAFHHGDHPKLRAFFSSLYGTALKGNPYLDMALMTGIQRVAKENIFSGLNNLLVCTAESQLYADCFGFTEEETRMLLADYNLELNGAVRDMYDGYRFGGKALFNPWSILSYAKTGQLAVHWVNTSGNQVLQERIAHASEEFRAQFQRLIREGELSVPVDLQTSSYEGGGDAAIWGLFVNAGYLTFADEARSPSVTRKLRIPNEEVRDEFKALVADCIGIQRGTLDDLYDSLVGQRDPAAFAESYKRYVMKVTSFYDNQENAYHMLMLGLCACFEGRYEIRSNRESGLGRSDILLRALRSGDPHLIIEFKQGNYPEKLAETALRQIHKRQYDAELAGPVFLLGVAHNGKECAIRFEKQIAPMKAPDSAEEGQ